MSAYTIDLLVMGVFDIDFFNEKFFQIECMQKVNLNCIIFVKEVDITKSIYCVCLVKFYFLFSECYTFKLQRHARDYHYN